METRKSHDKRLREGWFDKYAPASLPGIDIGCGDDALNASFRRWDRKWGDGDATLMDGVADSTFSTVYASHVLEHLIDPVTALHNWWRILKPGGHLIIVVPHRDLYEKRRFLPSQWNADHKTFWLPSGSEPPHTWGLREVIELALGHQGAEIKRLEILNSDYTPNGTQHAGGEYSIEAVIAKAPSQPTRPVWDG